MLRFSGNDIDPRHDVNPARTKVGRFRRREQHEA